MAYFFQLHEETFVMCTETDGIVEKLHKDGILSDEDIANLVSVEAEGVRHELCKILVHKDQSIAWKVLVFLQKKWPRSAGSLILQDMLQFFLFFYFPNESLAEGLQQDCIDLSSRPYFRLIQYIEAHLLQKNITINQVVEQIRTIFDENSAELSIPNHAQTDLPSLAVFLRKEGLCHEMDTDILCHVMKSMSNSAYHLIKSFSDCRCSSKIQLYDFDGICYNFENSHAIMQANLPSMTFEDVFFYKDMLSYYLGIKRHLFSLVTASQDGNCLQWLISAPFGRFFSYIHENQSSDNSPSWEMLENALLKASIQNLKLFLKKDDNYVTIVCPRSKNSQLSCCYHHPISQAQQDDLTAFSQNLKSTYINENLLNEAAGPMKRVEFINLALITKQGLGDADAKREEFIRDSLRGVPDDIEKKKKRIWLNQIFRYGTSPKKLILVEGAPGIGKTMLALKLCRDWAKDKLPVEYDIVLLIRLRRFRCKESVEVKDLVGIFAEGEHATAVTEHIIKSGGEKVLLIFEGWDELPPELRQQSSFFMDIVMGYKLSKASVLVTSRPSVSASLYDYMDERHIEVLGFNRDDIQKYINSNVVDGDEARKLISHLKKYPNVHALAHIPLTLSIMCNVVQKTGSLPHTLTKLYEKYILQVVLEAINKKGQACTGFNSFHDIGNNDVKGIIGKLSEVAFEGFKRKSFTFSSHDFGCSNHPESLVDSLDLLTSFNVSASAGHVILYQFVHLSVQEFLTAYHIKGLPHSDQISLLEDCRDDKQYQNVWKFLSGITKLKNDKLRDKLLHGTKETNESQLFLIHCLYEANDQEICNSAAEELKSNLNLHNKSLNPADCLCAAYVISTADTPWTVDLRGCGIGDEGLETFTNYLMGQKDEEDSFRREITIKQLNLASNQLHEASGSILSEFLKSGIQLKRIDLSSNRAFGDAGIGAVCAGLEENKTVTNLEIRSCKLTSHIGKVMAKMIGKNSTLKDLFIGHEKELKDEGTIEIIRAVQGNDTIEELSLPDTGLTRASLLELLSLVKINKTLHIIRLHHNNLTTSDCHILAEIISISTGLTHIDVSSNPIGNEGADIMLDAMIKTSNCMLQKLGMFKCDITPEGLKKLVDLFWKTKSFKSLQLGCNSLGDEGAKIIAKAIVANTSQSVRRILLERTEFSESAKEELERVRQSLARPLENDLKIYYKHHALIIFEDQV